MSDRFSLRQANAGDLAFCQRLYFASMNWIIERLQLDVERHRQGFVRQWQPAEVRIIAVAGEDVGWMQTTIVDDAVFLAHLYLDESVRRQGIGTAVMRALISEAGFAGKAVTLAVVKFNPARRLYERAGFHVTHEDRDKVYMRRDADRMVT